MAWKLINIMNELDGVAPLLTDSTCANSIHLVTSLSLSKCFWIQTELVNHLIYKKKNYLSSLTNLYEGAFDIF